MEISAAPVGQDTQVLAAPASVVSAITHIPTATSDQVGIGDINYPPKTVPHGTPLIYNKKPEVLYIGAEYCPYCALARWSLIGALSKFGTFHNLKIIRASATDSAGQNIATFTFAHGVTYSSSLISFVPREMFSNVPDVKSPTGYAPLQTLTKAEQTVFAKLDPPEGFPFVDFGGIVA
ncbi:protein containing DUF929, partial [mine drainage metagenome]